jgi:ferredoxin
MTKKTKLLTMDQKKCIGCMACVSLAPKIFRINKKGKSEVVKQPLKTNGEIRRAISNCPVAAISYQES